MKIHTIGIDLGKTKFHLVGLNERGEVVVRKQLLASAAAAVHREPEGPFDWHGSLRRLAFSGPGARKSRDTRCV